MAHELNSVSSGFKMLSRGGFELEVRKLKNSLLQVQDDLVSNMDMAYEAKDMLDEVGYEELRREIEIRNCFNKKVLNFFSLYNPLAFRIKMVPKIQRTTAMLSHVLRTPKIPEIKRPPPSPFHWETSSVMIEPTVYGRETDKLNIRTLLIDPQHSEEQVSVIPIVGIGGVGKTTLVRLIYNDEMVLEHFDLRIWICVSHDFIHKRILKLAIESIDKMPCDASEITALEDRLQKLLHGLKFLLVLDDLWSEDADEWSKLKSVLNCAAKGSKILITTRLHKVAERMGTTGPYFLQILSKDDCWSIIAERAFWHGRDIEDQDFSAIGREIAEKCNGIPLAAKLLGGLLGTKFDKRQWELIRDALVWNIGENDGVLPALKLSFDHLPFTMKRCFSYCAVFPNDHKINRKMLIQLWMAQGYLGLDGSLHLENIGNECFEHLLRTNFLQDVERSSSDPENVKTCTIHDLLVDLARKVTRTTCSSFEASTVQQEKNIGQTRHASLVSDQPITAFPQELYKAKKLHTFVSLVTTYSNVKMTPSTIFSLYKRLRVLDLSNTNIEEVTPSIGNMKLLRFLDLSRTDIKALPGSVTSLYYLQTLKTKHCHRLEELPKEARKLINLRHFVVSSHGYWTLMPRKIGQLTCLRTLPVFVVGTDKQRDRGIRELKLLNLLGGKLELRDLQNVSGKEDAESADLRHKENIRHLKLYWDNDKVEEIQGCDCRVLEGLKPHSNLKKLDIYNYRSVNFPTWMSNDSPLPSLVEISLWHCDSCEKLPSLGSCLRVLKLYQIKALRHWEEASYNSSLEVLIIEDCPNLRSMPTSFPALTELRLVNTNSKMVEAVVTRKITSIKNLVINGSPELDFLPEDLLLSNKFLQRLEIRNCPNFKAIYQSMENSQIPQSASLETLEICDCPSLISVPNGHDFPALRILAITDCQKLKSLPEGLQGLSKLEELRIGGFSEEFVSFPFVQYPVSLTRLEIKGWPKLLSLPEQVQDVTTLQKLTISDFPHLFALPEWLEKLTSLQRLEIRNCESLKLLPFKEGLHCVKKLRKLELVDCPLLKERCLNGNEEWKNVVKEIPGYSNTLS